MHHYVKLGIKIALLALFLAALYAVDFASWQLSGTVRTAPFMLLLMALLDTAVLAIPILRARWARWKLVGTIALLFFGVKTFVVALEAVYLTDVLPPDVVQTLLVNGAITAVLFSLAAVGVYGRWNPNSISSKSSQLMRYSFWGWLWRLALAGILWVVSFVATGLLVFQPLAKALDPVVADAYLAAFTPDSPGLILLFQAGRGILWALLTLPLIRMINGRSWQTGLTTALLYAVLMGSAMLLPNDTLPPTLIPAHLAEVVIENFLFGWIVVWLLGCPRQARSNVLQAGAYPDPDRLIRN